MFSVDSPKRDKIDLSKRAAVAEFLEDILTSRTEPHARSVPDMFENKSFMNPFRDKIQTSEIGSIKKLIDPKTDLYKVIIEVENLDLQNMDNYQIKLLPKRSNLSKSSIIDADENIVSLYKKNSLEISYYDSESHILSDAEEEI